MEETRTIPHRRKRRFIAAAGAACILAVAGVSAVIWHAHRADQAGLPATVVSQVRDFTPYFYPGKIPHGFRLDPAKAHYSEGVLLAVLTTSNNETVTLTEQQLPPTLAGQSREDFDEVKGVAGEAYITYQGDKMVGGLFSDSRHGQRTLVLVVANNPIEKSDMEDLLRGLRPVR